MGKQEFIKIKNCYQNNLKNIDIDIPLGEFVVFTGVSGAGKSSLVFDTIYAESQRRFFLSLSTFARQFFERIPPPAVEEIEGLQPSIAILRKGVVKNPRSTVATITEIYDFLRVLYSKISELYCPECGRKIVKYDEESLKKFIMNEYKNRKITIGFITEKELKEIYKGGFVYALIDGKKETVFKAKDGIKHIIIDTLIVNDEERIFEDIKTGFNWSDKIFVRDENGISLFSNKYYCPYCSLNFSEPVPELFSFNSSRGACPRCKGFGDIITVDEKKVIPDETVSIENGAIEIFKTPKAKELYNELLGFCKRKGIKTDVPVKKLSVKHKKLLFEGDEEYYGINSFFEWLERKKYKTHVRVFLSRYRKYSQCPVCLGGRLNREALSYRVEGKNIAELNSMEINEFSEFIKKIEKKYKNNKAVKILLQELRERVDYLIAVGLGYLSLNRKTFTLSRGEAQRISLTSVLGSTLTDTMILIDEPSKGLHLKDFNTLIKAIKKINGAGNTIIMIEHLEKVFKIANRIIEIGPGAGESGGEIIFSGAFNDYKKTKTYKNTQKIIKTIKIKKDNDKIGYFIKINKAEKYNLKKIDIKIPLNKITSITGVSGAGKSTLLYEILYKGLRGEEKNYKNITGIEKFAKDNVIYIDDSPPSRSSRAVVGTYLKLLDPIRKLFSELPESKRRGFTSSHFSYNRKEGQCFDCKGEGYVKIEMQFLSDIKLICDGCGGKRFKDEVLKIKFGNLNIYDIFELTLNEVGEIFRKEIPTISDKITILNKMGVGYLKLGQTLSTLSGGESQRIKLAKHMLYNNKGNQLFLIDEPTTGLHPLDISKIIGTMRDFIDYGATIVVVEHNPLFIINSDYIIDLGPSGGNRGGKIVFQGDISEFLLSKESITAITLRDYYSL